MTRRKRRPAHRHGDGSCPICGMKWATVEERMRRLFEGFCPDCGGELVTTKEWLLVREGAVELEDPSAVEWEAFCTRCDAQYVFGGRLQEDSVVRPRPRPPGAS